MDDVTLFFNGPSADYASLDTPDYPISELAKMFSLSEGVSLA